MKRQLQFLRDGIPYYDLKNGMVRRPSFKLRCKIVLQRELHPVYSFLFDGLGRYRFRVRKR